MFRTLLRWTLLAVAVVGVSAAATYFAQTLPGSSPADGTTFPSETADGKPATVGRAHAVIIEGGDLTYNFGTMSQYSTGTHTWIVKNEGDGDLQMTVGYKSCSCTIANLSDKETATVKPGESTTVKLTWNTKDAQDKYTQRAEILTPTDPNRQRFEFVVTGIVSPALVTVPPGNTIPFIDVANNESHKSRFALISPDMPDMQIVAAKSSNPERIDVTYEPLSKEEREQLDVEAGYRVEVILKQGMPLGSFREEVVIQTDHPKQKEMHMDVVGKAVGPISSMPERVRISTVTGDKPVSQSVTLWVRGQEHTNFQVLKAPKNLKVEVTQVDEKVKAIDPAAKAHRYRMTVTVPAGTPPAIIEDSVWLKTDHPDASEIKIPVNVTIKAAEQ